MENGNEELVVVVVFIILFIVFLLAMLGGAIKTFQRNWIAALALIILLFPVWVVWAMIEVFTGEITSVQPKLLPDGPNVEVNVVNHGNVNTDDDSFNIEQKLVQSAVKICPYCAEEVKQQATICRFCNREI
jgi:hypothetical protein